MQHFLIALCLFLGLVFFVLLPPKAPLPPPAPPGWTEAEKEYYQQIFAYTMDNVAAGTYYDWQSHSGKGTIAPQQSFVSKSGATCRNYSESFTMQGQTETASGVSCKRTNNAGWCRLKSGNALTCAMEKLSGAGGLQMGTGLGLPDINMNSNISTPSGPSSINPNVNPNIDAKPPGAPAGKDVADTVTGTAGKTAGTITGKSIEWFSNTFR